MIKIDSLSYAYIKNQNVFENLNLSIGEGEFWGILGENGAGKSTLMDLILGLKYPKSGSIKVMGKVANKISENEIAYLSQDIVIKNNISVKDFLDFHSAFYTNYSKSCEADLLTFFQIDNKSIISSLSTGKQKLVLSVACLASRAKILVVDEITAFLDPKARTRFFAKLLEFKKNHNLTILLATNISEDLIGKVDSILYINDNTSEVLDPSALSEVLKL